MNWYLKALKNYANFEGRARRKEYWMYTLFNLIIAMGIFVLSIILNTVSETLGAIGFVLYGIYALATLVPGLAVSVRRLHDINKSGWMLFVALIPFVGSIWLLVMLVTEGDHFDNGYGENPKDLPEFEQATF